MKVNITKEELFDLYVIQNLSVNEIAKRLNISTASVNRKLKEFGIKKDESLRQAKISKTKQNKTEEEKALYSQHISEARKGKGTGKSPWNKGTTGKQIAWNKGKKMSAVFCTTVKQGIANMSNEKRAEWEQNLSASLTGRVPWNSGISTGKWNDEEKQAILAKQYITKKQNNSFNSSKPEDTYYEYLLTRYSADDIIRQYSDDRYPFCCDFYIKSLDLFIELNLSWTHGNKLFDQTNAADIAKLHSWEEKAVTSDYYKNAIETWTVRDVAKHMTAIKNNLNYKVYYTEDELYE